jgi:signal transduction histidine kinase/CheY-like chemotaxis protein
MVQQQLDRLHAWLIRTIPQTFQAGNMPWVFLIMSLFGLIMLGLSIVNYLIFSDLAAAFVATAIFSLLLAMHWGLRLAIALHVGLAVSFVSIWIVIWNMGGLYSPRLAWLLLIPVAPFFFLGKRVGAYWLLAVTASIVAAGVFNITNGFTANERFGDVYLTHNWVILATVTLFLFVAPLAYHINNTRLLQELENKRQLLKQQQTDMEHTQAARDRFITCVSHELRTPMNAIMGLNEWLTYRVGQNSEAQQLLNHSAQSAEHLLTVLNDALDYTQIKSGKIKLHKQTFDLHECINNAFQMLVSKASHKGLLYTCHIDSSVNQWVRADRHRLVQVLVNLLNNAIKFTSQGSVCLHVTQRGHRAHFSVKDTGIGIDPALQPFVFERFNQGAQQTQPTYGGSGLGLAISRQLVELMHGSLQFQSQPKLGTCFFFDLLLPAQPAPKTSQPTPRPLLASAHNAWVFLVVDDHPINRVLLRKVLVTSWPKAQIIEASNGSEAVACVQSNPVHAVFMDMLMPIMDGIEATQVIRSLTPPLGQPVVVGLTANVNPEDLARFKGAGLDSIMLKPFNLNQLSADIDGLLNWRWSSQS